MTDCSKLQKKFNFNSKQDVKKWLLQNHPDKNENRSHPELSKIVECYSKNKFKYDKETNASTKSKPNNAKKIITKKKRDRLFTCMRKTANFSNIDNNFKFDKSSFNPKQLNDAIKFRSPKMTQLLENIQNLDELDMKNHGKTFKHFIFSDVKEGGYGAKIIASAFAANGYNNVIKARKIPKQSKLKLYIDYANNNKNFGLLSSNSVFGTNFNEKIKKELLKLFNERPDNINGKKLRFIIFDSGFKEGIDLFDVKYVHIFEPSMTIADLKQTIGRATRTCGQKGLDFIPNIGWPLYVYNYYLTVPNITQNTFGISKFLTNNTLSQPEIKENDTLIKDEDILVFKDIEKFNDATMLYSQFDKAMNNLSAQLYEIGPVLAVDHYLTNNLHNIEDLNHELMERDYYLMGGAYENKPHVNTKKDIKNVYTQKLHVKNPANININKNKLDKNNKIKSDKNKPRFDSWSRVPKNSKKLKTQSIQKSSPSPSKVSELIQANNPANQKISQISPHTSTPHKLLQQPSKNTTTFDERFTKGINKKSSRYFLINNIDCRGKCGKRSTKDVPVTTDFLKRVYLKYNHPKQFLPKKGDIRIWLCKYMRDEDNGYCKQVNKEWGLRYSQIPAIFEKAKTVEKIKDKLEDLHINMDTNNVPSPIPEEKNSPESINYKLITQANYPLLEYNGNKTDAPKKQSTEKIVPPTKLGFLKMRDFIKTNYNSKQYKWDKLIIENKCIPKKETNATTTQKSSSDIELNPTQNFITNYFCPESPYKGLLLWHSVGTGKTCSGVSIASTSFEKAGYNILWVTRTTLKSDVWKNIFDQICHSIIAHEVQNGLLIPDDISKRKRLLSDKWLEPMSYKQFSNLLAGKNSIYDTLRQRNGSEDVLKKTLIIIDEAHKLYGGDLKAAERPDTKIMEKLIMNSYTKSGKDSCKLLIMTATPFTNTPLELFSLINLFYTNEDEKFTTNKEEFKQQYMTSNGVLSESGIKNIANKLSGYISYLNREKDATQFAQPVMINVPVLMTHIEDDKTRNVIYLKEKFDNIKANNIELIKAIKEKIKILKEEIKNNKVMIKNTTADIKKRCKTQTSNKKDYDECIARIENETLQYTRAIEKAIDSISKLNQEIDKIKDKEVADKVTLNNMKKEAKQIELILLQEYALFKKCQEFKYKKLLHNSISENKITKNIVRNKTKSLSFNKSSNQITRKINTI